jgi:DNA modification methylase
MTNSLLSEKEREFLGSGTFGIAALKLKRQFIGIEKNPDRHAIAEARIARYLSS